MKFFLLMTLFSCAATFALADGGENESGLISDASSNDNEVAGQFEEENDEEMEDDDETYRWLAPDVYDALAERERRSVNARQIPEEKELEKKKNEKKGEGKGDKNKNKNKKKKLKKYTEEEKKLWFAPVGCFRDAGPVAHKNKSLRALPHLYYNQRGKLDWNITWQDFSNAVIMGCSTAAQAEGCPCFGVQFYAECWCDRSCKRFNIYKRSKKCFKGVGLLWTNFVYRGRCGSAYGCCQDGAMPALGPNYKGCPDCTTAVDLIFVVDASGSIGKENFIIIKKILLKLIRHFSVSSYHTRIGIVRYSTRARAVLRLHKSQRKGYRGVKKAIRNMKYTKGGTHTGKALALAEGLLKSSKKKLRRRFDEHEHDQAVVVLTDGMTSHKDAERLKAASASLKKIAHVIAVGVSGKGYNRKNKKKQQQELSEIASSQEDLFYKLNFTEVLKHVDPIAKRACPLIYKIKGNNKT